MTNIVPFEELGFVDLIVDAVYEGGSAKNTGADPIARLLPGVGNQGGFRPPGPGPKRFVVLYSSGEDGDWPDRLDLSSGQFVYFGDNKKPGHDLLDTRGGNRVLRETFQGLYGGATGRAGIAPFFVFTKCPTARSQRSVQFKGLAVPGFPGLPITEDLVAIWKITNGRRFENYRAVFTILNAARISRGWIEDLSQGRGESNLAPTAWTSWITSGKYLPLTAEPTKTIRTEAQQSASSPLEVAIVQLVYDRFAETPHLFEAFAAFIYQLTDPARVLIDEITRTSVDGGRDALGRYQLGLSVDHVYAEFALEAKCYRPPSPGVSPTRVGVSEVARLISRIRHREFGILVTTSVIARQAYEEVRGDRHPIIFLCGRDIAQILIASGYSTLEQIELLLSEWVG